MALIIQGFAATSLLDFEVQINAFLYPYTGASSCRVVFVDFSQIHSTQREGPMYEGTLTIDTVAHALTSPFEVKLFIGDDERAVAPQAQAFMDLNPTWFYAGVRYPTTTKGGLVSERGQNLGILFFNRDGTAGAFNWGETVIDPDAQDWYNRAVANGGTVSTSTLEAVSTFVADAKAAGVWDKLVRVNLFCGDWLAALVPLKTGGGFDTDLPQGSLASSYYAETGVQGGIKPAVDAFSGTKPTAVWIDTGWVPSDYLSVGDIHVGLYVNNLNDGCEGWSQWRIPMAAGVGGAVGFDGNPGEGYRIIAMLGKDSYWRFGRDLGAAGIRGHLIGTLKGGVYDGTLNGVTTGVLAGVGAGTISTSKLFVLAGAGPANISEWNTSSTVAAYHVGHGLTHAEAVALSAAMVTFQKALGRWVHEAVADWQRRCVKFSGTNSWSSLTLTALNDFVLGVEAAGLLPKIQRANLFAGASGTSVIPLLTSAPYWGEIGTGTAADTARGHESTDFLATAGWEKTAPGNSVGGYSDTPAIPRLVGGIAVWVKEIPSAGTAVAGWANALHPAETEAWRIDTIAGNIGGSYGGDIVADAVSFAAPVPGFFHLIRAAANDLRLFSNGVQVAANLNPSVATATPGVLFTEAQNVGLVADADVENTVRTFGYSIESVALTPAEALTYYNLWLTAMTSFGRMETFGLLTESGDNLMTQNGKQLATESA